MAKLVTPGREVIRAMEELGLDGWIHGAARHARVRTTVHRDEIRLTRPLAGREFAFREETAGDDAGVARLLRTLNQVAPHTPRTRHAPRMPQVTPGRTEGARVATGAGLVLAGLGLLALSALLGLARR